MAQQIEESLLQAVKKDDIKAFNALMEKAQCGAYRLGRFPVLSLLYLYKSRKILSAYEERFLKITSFEPLREPAEISKKFSAKAGKCLRLYLSEIVSPLEMLLILDKTGRLKRVYPKVKPSSAVKARLVSVYSIKYALTVKFEGDEIIIDRRPLSYREKKNIATVCLCSVLAVTLAVGVPVTLDALIPKPVEGEVFELSHIDFNSAKEYTLKRDITLPENYTVEKVNCKIIGDGHKLVFGKGANFGELNGNLSGLTIESTGGAVFTSVSETATIENVIINVSSAVEAAESTAFVALTNYGTIDGVTVNVSGKINALAPSTETTAELNFGGIVQSNSYKYVATTQTVFRGFIKNSVVNYSEFTLVGETGANAAFGGVAGINNGYLQDCTVKGEIIADTFDIAGICSVNNGLLYGGVNEANLSQVSADKDWNPISCGIVINNAYAVENCENKGLISAVSNCEKFKAEEGNTPAVSAAGIAYISRSSSVNPYITNSSNSGNIVCRAEYRSAYAAGVCVSSSGGIEKCTNSGDVEVNTGNGCEIYAGGITALAYGNIYQTSNKGAVSAEGGGSAYIGGISGHSRSRFLNCVSSGDITVTAQTVYAGGIFGFGEVASYGFYVYCGTADYCISGCKIKVSVIDDTKAYVGGIVGCVSEQGFNGIDEVVYFGGGVTGSYFTGECASEISNFGNIVGVCGENIYKSNSFTSDNQEYKNFENNYYSENSFGAFGAAAKGDGSFISADEDKGATSAKPEDILNSETYNSILKTVA